MIDLLRQEDEPPLEVSPAKRGCDNHGDAGLCSPVLVGVLHGPRLRGGLMAVRRVNGKLLLLV